MTTITIKQVAYRIANRINSVERKDREFTKSDFTIGEPLPKAIWDEFTADFPYYSQIELNEFTGTLIKLVEA